MARAMLVLVLLAAVAPGRGALAGPLEIVARNSLSLGTSAVDQHGTPFTVTGMSGIALLGPDITPGAWRFAAVMDNSNKVVTIRAGIGPDGSLTSAVIVGGLTLSQPKDFEGIVFLGGDRVLLSEETTPAIHEHRLTDGALVGGVAVPPIYLNRRTNRGLESLALSPDARTLWTCNEEALTVDGPLSTTTSGTVVRMQRFVRAAPGSASFAPSGQFAYVTQPIHGPLTTDSRSGVVEMVRLRDGRVIAMERSLALTTPLFQTRIYEVDFTGATDVSTLPGLVGATYTPATKRLLWIGGLNNLEGLCVGPGLGDPGEGRFVLVGIVDDGDPVSTNRILAFELRNVGPPAEASPPAGATPMPVPARWP